MVIKPSLWTARKYACKGNCDERQKNWRSLHRQFLHIMGDTHQTPLGFDLLHAPEIEPAEFSVVLNMPEDRLHLDIAQDAKPLAFF
jgi:hypothetical protein